MAQLATIKRFTSARQVTTSVSIKLDQDHLRAIEMISQLLAHSIKEAGRSIAGADEALIFMENILGYSVTDFGEVQEAMDDLFKPQYVTSAEEKLV